MADLSLTVTQEISSPIEQVYKAWLDPEVLAQFMIPGAGMTVPMANVDAREGGRFDIIMVNADKEMPHGGEYKVLKPFSQIVFTWESPFSIDGSMVTINFSETNGITRIELIHVKFPDEESCTNHNAGWLSILSKLESTLTQ